jgi:hypothetical protein
VANVEKGLAQIEESYNATGETLLGLKATGIDNDGNLVIDYSNKFKIPSKVKITGLNFNTSLQEKVQNLFRPPNSSRIPPPSLVRQEIQEALWRHSAEGVLQEKFGVKIDLREPLEAQVSPELLSKIQEVLQKISWDEVQEKLGIKIDLSNATITQDGEKVTISDLNPELQNLLQGFSFTDKMRGMIRQALNEEGFEVLPSRVKVTWEGEEVKIHADPVRLAETPYEILSKKTKQIVTLRELSQKGGNVLNLKTLNEELQRLYQLGPFQDIRMNVKIDEEKNEAKIQLEPLEKERQNNLNISGGISNEGPVGGASITFNNLGGMYRIISLSGEAR